MSRITLALPSLDHGGAEKVFLELAEYYCRQGHDVDLILLNKVGSLVGRIHKDVNLVDFTTQGCRYFSLIKQVYRVNRWVKREGLNSVLSTVTGMNLFMVLTLFFSSGTKLILREANSLENVSGVFVRFLMWCCYRRADKIICTSQYCLEQFEVGGFCSKEKLIYLPNPIAIDSIVDKSKLFSVPKKKTNLYRLVCVSRLVYQKGVDVLIDAVALIDGFELELLVVGDGPDLELLKKKVLENKLEKVVTFSGYQANPYPFMKSADLFVLPSRWEGYVNTLIEAMALGVPVLATDCKSGPTDLIRSQLGSLLVSVDDPFFLAREIENMHSSNTIPNYTPIIEMHDFSSAADEYLNSLN